MFRRRMSGGMVCALLGLFWLLISPGLLHALDAYVATDANSAMTEPPNGGGNGWANGGGGVTMNPGDTIWVGCRNSFRDGNTKVWNLKLTSTGLPGDIDLSNVGTVNGSEVGFNKSGGKITARNIVSGSQNASGIQTIRMEFLPQPEWEQVAIKNKSSKQISFTIEATAVCSAWTTAGNTLRANNCVFGAANGTPQTNPIITQIFLFPQTVALDPGTPPTFTAPISSGTWTPSFVYLDPQTNSHPLGGVYFSNSGPGLNPSESCSFSFAMQGPAADLQYTLYAYDTVLQEFQEFDIELRPTLSISNNNSGLELGFDSVLGFNYTLQSTPDFHLWQPLQSFSGSGGILNGLTLPNGPFEFFRLLCQPATDYNTPPTLNAITGDAFSNTMLIEFSKPVDGASATNGANYGVGGGSGQIPVLGISQLWSREIELVLASNLMPTSNYVFGVHNVQDLYGNVISPTTDPLTPATLQTPCPGGTLLASQVYSMCNADGFWHVVQDDFYACPGGGTQRFRVADTKTTQPCGQPIPSPVGSLYPTSADVAPTCQSPVLIGQVILYECVGGLWSASTYQKYQCQDGTVYLSGPIQNVPVNPPTSCGQPPPPPS